MTTGVVAQLGVAIMPLCQATSSALISGTTRGTSGSIRQAPVLSMTTAPAFTALGEYSRETSSGIVLKTTSQPSNQSRLSGTSSSYCSPTRIIFASDGSVATSVRLAWATH